MPLSRRHFLASSAASAAGLALSASALAALRQPSKPALKPTPTPTTPPSDEFDDTNIKPAPKKLKLLILGGTAFTGPHLVRLALARGHTVTVFNRGKTEKRIGALPSAVESLHGDRDPKVGEGLKALDNDREWDAVVDTSGYVPRIVRASAELLAKRVKHYTFISSISVYKQPIKLGADESAELDTLTDPTTEEMGADFHNYGPLKVACEKVIAEVFPSHNAIVRPTFISGPGDPTDRFTYWPVRTSKGGGGGEMACPGAPTDPMQYIDVRDLAAFLLHISENAVAGIYNAAGPSPACTIGDIVTISKEVSRSDTTFTWIDNDFLEKTKIPVDFTIHVSPSGPEAGMARVNFDAALRAGLKLRPLRDTIAATLAWWPQEVQRRTRVTKELMDQAEKEGKPAPKLGDPTQLRAGLKPDVEKQLLAEWHKVAGAKEEKKG